MANPTVKNIKVVNDSVTTGALKGTWSAINTSTYAFFDHYTVVWKYYDGGTWISASTETTTKLYSTYTPPSGTNKVRLYVKAVQKAKKDLSTANQKKYKAWTFSYAYKEFAIKKITPTVPSTPTVSISGYTLTVRVDNITDANTKTIKFDIVRDDTNHIAYRNVTKVTQAVSYSMEVEAGHTYKARAMAISPYGESDYSSYSSNVASGPSTPSGLTATGTNTAQQAYLTWDAVSGATSYSIQYTTSKAYFDNVSDLVTTVTSSSNSAYINGLEFLQEYWVRVAAVNDNGTSGYSEPVSVTLTSKPNIPTTWSSSITAISGNTVSLYWVHSASDESAQSAAEVEIYLNGSLSQTLSFTTETYVDFSTSGIADQSTLTWRARTKGSSDEWSDYSVTRAISIYAPATISAQIVDSEGTVIEEVTGLPIRLKIQSGPATQTPISYYVAITNKNAYQMVNDDGTAKIIQAGTELFYESFANTSHSFITEYGASQLSLENGEDYTITAMVSTDAGLTATDSFDFTVNWGESAFEPSGTVSIGDDLSASILLECDDNTNVTMSVYRHDYNGEFTKIIDNALPGTTVTDEHPALDYARYRIVGKSSDNGQIEFTDLPSVEIGEKSIVIQWDESDTPYNLEDGVIYSAKTMLKMPYDIKISEKTKPDRAEVEYIGRKRPVAYYGTQLGESATWSCDILKSDTESLYKLRRLAVYQGNVYVREPSGTGYYAVVEVSDSISADSALISVSLDVTRVEV